MRCNYCQEYLPDDSTFCSSCGQSVKAQAVEPAPVSPDTNAQSTATIDSQSQNYSDPSPKTEPYISYSANAQSTSQPPINQQPNYNSTANTPGYTANTPGYTGGTAAGGIPQGYVYDARNGQYYTSRVIVEPYTNKQVTQVTYYNPQTRLYSTVNYPMGHNQYQQSPPQKSNTTAIVIIIAVFLAIMVFFAIINSSINKVVDNTFDRFDKFSDPYSDFYDGYNSDSSDSYDSYSSDYSANRIPDLARKDILPLFDGQNASNSADFPHGSFFSSSTVEVGQYLYFLSDNYIEQSRYIMQYDTKTDKTETIIDVGYDKFIEGFAISGDSIIFSVCETYSSDYDYKASYYSADLSTFEYKFLCNEISSQIVINDGYVYLVDDITEDIIIIGLDTDGKPMIGSYDLGLDSYTYAGSSPFSISDNHLYLYSYNDSDTDLVYKYNLDSMSSVLIFQGQPGFFHENYFINGDRIFYSKYDIGDNENWNVIIASSKLGQLNSEEVYYTYKNSYEWTEHDIFLGKNSDSFFYSEDGKLNKASLSDPKTIVESIDQSDFPNSLSENWIVTSDSIISTADLSSKSWSSNHSDVKIEVDTSVESQVS